MKTSVIAITALIAGFLLAYFLMGTDQSGAADSHHDQQYTCGMHPEIVSSEPGYCPICEMKLTPKKDGTGNTGSVFIDPRTRQNMGLVTAPATYQKLRRSVRVYGEVAANDSLVHTVSTKIEGWIEHLHVDREGVRVEAGQPMLEIYSPALVAAQQEFLIALRTGDDMSELLEASHLRLANWDISEDQIAQLERTGEVTRTMILRAPASGIVTSRNVDAGQQIRPGAELYRVADLSQLWVIGHVYEQDLPYVAHGQSADVAIPGAGDSPRKGRVSYVAPFLDDKGQAEIRIVLDNADAGLKPDMYAEISLTSELSGEPLTVPRAAIINSGRRQIAYVALEDNHYEPRQVTTGAAGDGDLIEVTSGLAEGEAVVVSGQFLLDSEARLSEALGKGAMVGHNHGQAATEHESSDDFKSGEMPEASDHNHGHAATGHESSDDSDPDELVANGGHDVYTCPMPSHYHVLQYGEGRCPECNMALVPLADTDNRQVYVCPMSECEITRDHRGNCDVCGMNLIRYQPEASDDR